MVQQHSVAIMLQHKGFILLTYYVLWWDEYEHAKDIVNENTFKFVMQ